jgi:hypothetical protein
MAILHTQRIIDAGSKLIELHLKYWYCSYHASLSRLYALQGNVSGSLAEYSIFRDRVKEVPNDAEFIDQKTKLLCAVSNTLAKLNQNSEAIALLEETYNIVCCEKGPADERLQNVFGSLIELYEKTGMYDKAELFAREALGNMLTHEDNKTKKLVFETKLGSDLARILIWQARHPSDRPIESREALLNEAEGLYRRSFDILSGGLIKDLPTSTSVHPIIHLTGLIIDRQQFTPELERFLLLEIDILIRKDVEKEGKEKLCMVVALAIRYASDYFSASGAAVDASASGGSGFRGRGGPFDELLFEPEQIMTFAEKGLAYCKHKCYHEGSGVVKLLREVLARIKNDSNGQI